MSDDPRSALHTPPSLLVRLRDPGDGVSWQMFVDTYAPLIYRWCRGRGLQDADAADVSQEVLTQVARSLRSFEYDRTRGRFRDWLGTVTRGKLARFFEKQRHAARGEGDNGTSGRLDELAAPEADAEWTAAFNTQVLQTALDRVRPHFEPTTWDVFERLWLADQPVEEVATALGLQIDVVYQAKSRVLKRLRQEVLDLAEDVPHLLTPPR